MANVEVFQKYDVKLEGQGQEVKKLWLHVKGLVIENTHVKYESPISYGIKVVLKLWPMLKFFKSRSNCKVKVTR